MTYQMQIRELLDLLYDARRGLEDSIKTPQPESSPVVQRINKLADLSEFLEKWEIKKVTITKAVVDN